MTEQEIISAAARIHGRKGGKTISALKSDMARLNGKRKYLTRSEYLRALEELKRKHRKEP